MTQKDATLDAFETTYNHVTNIACKWFAEKYIHELEKPVISITFTSQLATTNELVIACSANANMYGRASVIVSSKQKNMLELLEELGVKLLSLIQEREEKRKQIIVKAKEAEELFAQFKEKYSDLPREEQRKMGYKFRNLFPR